MSLKRVAILGAGPAGLSAGYELAKSKKYSIELIEMDSQVGGISKTVNFNGNRFDIGGHRFFSKIKEVNELWNQILKQDFLTRPRKSRIYYRGKFYNYPIEVKNALWNLGLIESGLILQSYISSKLKPYPKEETFEQWVSNRFGKRLYSMFFKTYTEKLWGIPCNQIQAEWAVQRIKGLSLTSAVLNSLKLNKKTQIKSLIEEFKYPKLGPGMMYEKIAEQILQLNKTSKIHLNTKVKKIIKKNKSWEIHLEQNNKTKKILADEIISSIPLTELIKILNPSPNKEILEMANNLKFRGFITACLIFDKKIRLKDTWLYVHDKVNMGRTQIMQNWSPFLLKNQNNSSLGVEYFCTHQDSFWNKSDNEIINLANQELRKIKLINPAINLIEGKVIKCKDTYPVYDEYYKKNIQKIKDYISNIDNLQVIGRGGMFKYNNMDHSIYTGILAAKNIIEESKKYDLWKVNQDEEYHEEKY